MYHHDERDVAEYQERMKTARQFKMFHTEPSWIPGTGDIEGFCRDEVVRQFHDPSVRDDGGVRVGWMHAAWEYAQRASQGHPDVEYLLSTTEDILALGALVEPKVNSTIGFRTMNVYIGNTTGAPPRFLNDMMVALVQQADVEPILGRKGPHPDDYRKLWNPWMRKTGSKMDDIPNKFAEMVKQVETADDWYLAYEAIHPFGDGNGRTGKILHNWLLGTLDEPVLVEDYFGGNNP